MTARSAAKCRLLAKIPEENGGAAFEVFARQLYREQEVGRVTWRLAPRAKEEERKQRKKQG